MSNYDEDRYVLVGNEMPHAIWGKSCWDGAIIAYEEHDKFYWINIGVFGLDKHYYGNDIGVIVTSDAPEFEIITDMIKYKDNSIIEEYANELVVSHMNPSKVYKLIKKLSDTRYKQGIEYAQEGMRKALGIFSR